MGWKKLILGDKMPDKNDPKYKERYESEVEAGRRFAKWSRIDKVAGRVQRFANEHTWLFGFILVFFIIWGMTLNVARIIEVCTPKPLTTAVERQRGKLQTTKYRLQTTNNNDDTNTMGH